MADEPKPKASFLKKLGGSAAPSDAATPPKQPVAVAAAAPVASVATPASGSPLRKLGGAIPASAPVAVAAPVTTPSPVSAGVKAEAHAPIQPIAAPKATPVSAAKPEAGNRAKAEQHLQIGLDHYDRQELEPALQAYQACVDADPSFALGYNNLGMVLIDLERYEDALQVLYQSIRCAPDYSEAYNNLGFVLRRVNRNVEAISAYKRFLELDTEVDEGPRILQWTQTVLTDNNLTSVPPFVLPGTPQPAAPTVPEKIKKMAAWEMSAEDIQTAAPVSVFGDIEVAATPPPSVPGSGLAAGLPPAGGSSGTAPSLGFIPPKTTIQSAPNFLQPLVVETKIQPPSALVAKIVMSETPATSDPSATTLAKTATAQPSKSDSQRKPDVITLIESGMDNFANDNLEKACSIFQKALEVDPLSSEANAGMGKVLVRMEKMHEGLEFLEKSIALDPQDPSPYYVKGFALRALEKNIEAAEAYEVFLNLMPHAVDADKIKQWVSHIKGVSGASANALDEDHSVLDVGDVHTEEDRQYKTAAGNYQNGNVDDTFTACVAILNADPGHFRSRVLLGRAFEKQADYDSAIEQLEGALVTQPDYPEALYFLAQAASKKGDADKTLQNYQRYLEVSPDGPRAHSVREKLAGPSTGTHPSAANTPLGAGTLSTDQTAATQCELCLRVFAATELTRYEDKATCSNCLELMGVELPKTGETSSNISAAVATPSQAKLAAQPQSTAAKRLAPPENLEPTLRRSKKTLLLVTLFLLAGAGGGYVYWQSLQQPAKIGRNPGTPIDPSAGGPGTAGEAFDLTKVKFKNEPATLALAPYALWTYQPQLDGLPTPETTPDPALKNIKVTYALKGQPEGMILNENGISWTPQSIKLEELRPGKQITVDVIATGKAESAEKDLFTISKTLTLTIQMNYEFSKAYDLGLENNERLALAAGDLNGDKLTDLVICSGDLRKGKVRTYVQRGENPLPPPTPLASGGRHSAVCVADLDGNNSDDLLVANWHTGELKLFYQEDQSPRAGPSLAVGPGPVALGVGRFDDSPRVHVGVLLGLGDKLVLTSIGTDRTFGPEQTIPLLSGGGPVGWVFPWKSTEAGYGFLVVSPLSDQPLQFIPYANGKWGTPLVSSLTETGLIRAAAVLQSGKDQPATLVLGLNAESSKLLLCTETNGKFAASSPVLTLTPPEKLLNLVAADFNHDGLDDILVVSRRSCEIYCNTPTLLDKTMRVQLVAGLKCEAPSGSGFQGTATLYRPTVSGAEVLLINEDRHAFFLKPVPLRVTVEPKIKPVETTDPIGKTDGK